MEKQYIQRLTQVKKVGSRLLVDASRDGNPVGTILYTASPTPPPGYLICNGALVGRATYPDLFDAIGETYGAGDGQTTFALPNLMNRVAWGDNIVGMVKDAGLPNITGSLKSCYITSSWSQVPSSSDGAFSILTQTSALAAKSPDAANGLYGVWPSFNASRSNPIYGNSTTVQPPALTLLPVIKAFGQVLNPGEMDASKLAQDLATANTVIQGLENRKEEITEKGQGYVRYASGLQICFGRTAGTRSGQYFYYHYPKPFSSFLSAAVTADLGDSDVGFYMARLINSVNSIYTLYWYNYLSGTLTVNQPLVDYIAFGYWK